MKFSFIALLALASIQVAQAEDSVSCANGLNVAWTDDSTINVSGLPAHQRLQALLVLQKGDRDYVRIQEEETVLRSARLLKVKLVVDSGASVKTLVVFNWNEFSDGEPVTVEYSNLFIDGRQEVVETVSCDAAQS